MARSAKPLFCLHAIYVFAFCCLPASLLATDRHWTGAISAYWSVPGNWEDNGIPVTGDRLFFAEHGDDSNRTMTNDIVNLQVSDVRFGTDNKNYTVNGNAFTLNLLSANCDGNMSIVINCPLIFQNGGNIHAGAYAPLILDNTTHIHLNGPITVNGGVLTISANTVESGGRGKGHIHVSAPISGTGSVLARTTQDGHGSIVEFQDAQGDTFIGSGTLYLATLGNSEIRFNNPSGFVITNRVGVRNGDSARLHLSRPDQMGDAATISVSGGGHLTMSGNNVTVGTLAVTNSADDTVASILDTADITIGINGGISAGSTHGSLTPTIQGTLNLNGVGNFNIGGSVYAGLSLLAQMGSAGGFTKTGTAALILPVANTFSGPVSVEQGVLDIQHAGALGSTSGGLSLGGGSATLRTSISGEMLIASGQGIAGTMPGALLNVVGNLSWNGPVVLNTNLVVIGGDLTLTNLISGSGGLGCFSSGTMQIGGTVANTYTGTTLVRSPLLQLNKPFGVNACAGPLEVGGATGGPYEVRWLASYQVPNTPLTIHNNGIVNLNGVTENFGPVIFNGGTVTTGTGFFVAENSITVNPSPFTATINGNLTLGIAPFNFIIGDGVADPDLLINAVISGSSLVKQGAGRVLFANANTYVGATTVAEGILQVQNPDGLGSAGAGTIVQSNATLTVGGSTAEPITINGHGAAGIGGALFVTAGATKTLSGPVVLGSPSTIHVVTNGSLVISSTVSGTGPLTKAGPGALTFAGAGNNSFSGDTVVAGGTLALGKNTSALIAVPGNLIIGPPTSGATAVARLLQGGGLAVSSTVTANANSLLDLNGNNLNLTVLNLNDGGDVQTGAGTLNFLAGAVVTVGTQNLPQTGLHASASISGKIALPHLDYLTFNVGPYGLALPSPDPELVVPANISAAGNIIKNGLGGMRLSGANTFNDAPPFFSGDVFINAGTVVVASPSALGGTGGWTWVNNDARLTLINGITVNNETLFLNSSNPVALDNPGGSNIWTGSITLSRDTGISVNQDWSFTAQGVINGSGSLTKSGGGTLRFSGSSHNSYAGDTYVNEGILALAKNPNLQAAPGNLIVGKPEGGTSAIARHFNTEQISGDLTVNNGGLLDLNGFNENIGVVTLNGGGDIQTGLGTLHLFTTLTVNPDGFADQSVISGRLGLYPGTLQMTVGAGPSGPNSPDCIINANIVQSSSMAGIQKFGNGGLLLGGNNTYAGSTIIFGGSLWVNGTQPQSPILVNGGSRLRGSGTVGHITLNGSSSIIAPGTSPGILTCSNFNAGAGGTATLEIELDNYVLGSYDRVNARGTVNLNGITFQGSLGFFSSVSNLFTIIDNDGTDAVIGTFTGLPEGSALTIGGESFHLTYIGGTGNDVVLTRLPTPPRPALVIENLPPIVRLLWPTNDPAYFLQSSTNLSIANWVAVSPPPVVFGTNFMVTNSTTPIPKFYRLNKP